MANKRDSSRQKRSRQNRAQRAALQARTQGKAPARPSRVAPATADKLQRSAEERPSKSSDPKGTTKGATKGSAKSGSAADGGKKRKKRERPPRPGDVPVDVTTLEGSWVSRMTHVPGGLQAMFGGGMAIVATGMVVFSKSFVSEVDRVELGDKAKASQTIFEFYDPAVSIPLVVIPLIIAGLAVAASFHPQRRRIWLGAALLLGLLSVSVLPLLLFVAGFFLYAVFRASKVEGKNKPLVQSVLDRRRAGRGEAAVGEETADEVDERDSSEVD